MSKSVYNQFKKKFEREDVEATPGSGTVTSVAIAVPDDLTVTGSPITGDGTLTITRDEQAANLFLASPDGATGVPSYRAIEVDDLPTGALAQEPMGHDITQLDDVIAHWPMKSTILGGTSIPDVVANVYDGTAASTIKTTGRPWYSSDDQVWITRKVALAGTASLLTAMRDASCAWMGWVYVSRPSSSATAAVLFTFSAAGETLATNSILQIQISDTSDLVVGWEYGAGTNVTTTLARLAPGLHHIAVGREHGATSTVHFWVDGDYGSSTSGLTNPAGGTSAAGYLMVDNTGSLTDTQNGAALGDSLLISGSIPTTAQVLIQYLRGRGVYDGVGGGSGTVTSVAMTTPADLVVTGSPITSSGTLAVTRANQAASLFLASPVGGSGVPSYRAIDAADLPASGAIPLGSIDLNNSFLFMGG